MNLEPFFEIGNINGFNEFITETFKTDKFIMKKSIDSNNNKYKIVSYNKSLLSNDLISTNGLIRSVVINKNNKIVSFAPPKSIPLNDFIKNEPEKKEYIIAEEFIEGTMINLFWIESDNVDNGYWELSTRSCVGANSSFYKTEENLTFRDMFMETIKLLNFNLNNLNNRYSYSFVLQHPKNRIVVPFETPSLYLVSIYQIFNNTNNKQHIVQINMLDIREKYEWVLKGIKFPQIYKWNNYTDLIYKYASMNTSYKILGVVIHNLSNGTRTKIRNPNYEIVRNLRGNQPKLQYQYLKLRKEEKVKQFLTYYPEYKDDFAFFRVCLHNFTSTLYKNYISCYIKKEQPLIEFPQNFRTHMFNIHQFYIKEFKQINLKITYSFVISFVNELPINLLLHSLNFSLKKINTDLITSNNTEDYLII